MYQMIGAEWCEKCQQAKKILKERGFWDSIEYINYDEPKAKDLVEKYGADTIPFFIGRGKLYTYFGELLEELEK